MTFAVIWKASANQEADRIRAYYSDPEAVRRAIDNIDYNLRRTPGDMGESREPGFRVWYGDVVGVFYHIDDVADRVNVLAVAPARRR